MSDWGDEDADADFGNEDNEAGEAEGETGKGGEEEEDWMNEDGEVRIMWLVLSVAQLLPATLTAI